MRAFNKNGVKSQCAGLVILSVLVASGASCGSGSTTQPPPPPPPSMPSPTLLVTLYRLVNGNDRISSVGPSERQSLPLEAQTYYIAAQTSSAETALNRVVNAAGTDHAETISSMTGYSQDLLLGSVWTSAVNPGMAQLIEAFNSGTGDHALLAPSENLAGYVGQPMVAYAYPRFGNAAEVILPLSASGVTIESNAVAGGALWRWTWNGVQFVNHYDYGREIQDAFYFGMGPTNPDEAGDFMTANSLDQSIKHGSPVIQFQNQGTTQITRAIPLEWHPQLFGGDQDHPVIWDTLVLGKDIALNFNNLGPVAKYTSHLVLPDSTFGTLSMPAGYLNSNFNRYWTYDAQSTSLTEVTTAMPNGCTAGNSFGGYSFNASFGGIIMSNSSTDHAMGIYGVDLAHGGSLSYWAMWKFFCANDGAGEYASDTTAWSAVYGHGNDLRFPKGESTYNVYIITDTLQNVTARMDDLFAIGVR